MKKFIFGLLLLLTASQIWAQSDYVFRGATTKISPMEKVKKGMIHPKIAFLDSTIYYLHDIARIFFSKNSTSLYTYDANMKIKKRIDLKPFLMHNDKQSIVENLIASNGNIYLYSSVYDGKANTNSLFLHTIDKNTLELKNAKKIAEIPEVKSRGRSGEFKFISSRDTSKHLIYCVMPRRRKEKSAYSLTVLDADMNQIWQKNVEQPYEEKIFDQGDYYLDNAGNAYLIGWLFNQVHKEKLDDKPNYLYKVFKYSKDESEAVEFDIALQDKYIKDLAINVIDDLIICAGFYGNKSTTAVRGERIAGTFYASFDPKTKSFVKESYYKFDEAFLTENLNDKRKAKTERALDKNKDVLHSYKFRDFITRPDSSAILVAEQYFVKEFTRTDQKTGRTTTNYHYFYQDIIVININPNGEIAWAKKIPKNQHTVNDDGFYSSFLLVNKADKLYFIFNDNIKNIPQVQPNSGIYMDIRKKYAAVAIVEVSPKGEVKRSLLSSRAETNTILLAKFSEQITQNQAALVQIKMPKVFSPLNMTLWHLNFD
jgi:hypothetical protein